MAVEFIGTPKQIRLVHSLADQAYREFARDMFSVSIERVYKGPYCMEMSYLLIDKLLDKDYKPKRRGYGSWHQHVYLGNYWIADPTWQQFPRHGQTEVLDLPKVLITHMSLLSSTLSHFGIDTELQKYWLDATILIN